MSVFSPLFFISIYISIGICALAGPNPVYHILPLADKLTTRQAAGSVPASQFVRRAFQGCKCCCDLKFIHLSVTKYEQLLSLETGSILTEVNFPITAEGSNMSTVSAEPHAELAPPINQGHQQQHCFLLTYHKTGPTEAS